MPRTCPTAHAAVQASAYACFSAIWKAWFPLAEPGANRWDGRYQEDGEFSRFRLPRPFLVSHQQALPSSGLALDAACGLGDNAIFLLEKGIKVVGVDLSVVGIRRAKRRLPVLSAILADLTRLNFADNSFDVILNFYFLERSLFQSYRRWLKPGGLLVFETLTRDMAAVRPDIDPQYLLAPGELHEAFQDWTILEYRQGWEPARGSHRKATASLLARRP